MIEMSFFEIVINIVLTIIAYMGFPFYKFYLSKESYDLKFKKKVIFWNSVIGAILFTLIRLYFYGYDNTTINFAPAFLYYIINRFLYTRKHENEENIFLEEYDEDLEDMYSNEEE